MADAFDFESHLQDEDAVESEFDFSGHLVPDSSAPTTSNVLRRSGSTLRAQANAARQQAPILDRVERGLRVKQLFEETELGDTKKRIQGLPEGPARDRQMDVFDRLVDLQVQDIRLEDTAKKRGLSKEAQRVAETPLQESLAQASQLERTGRRAVSSLGMLPVNMTTRALGLLGVEGATEAADNNNRLMDLQNALEQANDRESVLAEMTSPAISEGVSAIGELGLTIPLLGGGATKIESAVRLATFYGLSSWDAAITDGKDAGLSGATLGTYAVGMGALEAGIMLTFAGLASKFGFTTAEEVFSGQMKQAAARLLSKTGVYETIKSFAVGGGAEAVEEGLTAGAQQTWGVIFGANSFENIGANVGKAAVTGFFAPGALQLPGKFAKAYGEAVEFAQATGQGTVDASRFTQDASDAELQTAAEATTQEEFETATGKTDTIEKYRESYQEFLASFLEGKKRQEGVVPESDMPPESSPAEAEVVQASSTQPSEPVETDPSSVRDGEENTPNNFTTARIADVEQDAADMGLGGFYSSEYRSQAMLNSEALKLPAGTANTVANRVIREGGGITSLEQEAMKIQWSALKTERRSLSERLVATENKDEITYLGTELTRVREEAELIRNGIELGRSDLGRALVLGRSAIAEDYSPLGLVAQAKSAKGENTTPKEEKGLRDKGKSYEKIEDAIAKLEPELKGKVALKLLADQNSKLEQEDLRLLYTKAKELFDAGCNV